VLGDLDPWREGLEQVGVELLAGVPSPRPDLVVAPHTLRRAAEAADCDMIILEGSASRRSGNEGYISRRFLARPAIEHPSLLLPLDAPVPARYAIDQWSVVDRGWKRVRALVARTLVERGLFPQLRSTITILTRTFGVPHIVKAAARFGIPDDAQWALTLGQGDVLSRNVFHIFAAGAKEPSWVIKFARIPGYREPFDRDERGLTLASSVATRVPTHAPRLLGRFEEAGLHASVESAATGRRLREWLSEPGPQAAKVRLIETIADWVVELGRKTSGPPEALAPERRRLTEEVVPQWSDRGARPDLAERLPSVNPVLQHNDLGSWNIVVANASFTALDWESARASGLPLWDLFYFLADALAVLDGSVSGEQRDEHTIPLFRGELPSSRILFRWTSRAVEAARVPPSAVGPIATLCWLHHSLSHVHRAAALEEFAVHVPSPIHGTERIAALWLGDPALGERWDRWQRD
jgi:Phosphotransferase enzyme family